jgi:hypothetical protein
MSITEIESMHDIHDLTTENNYSLPWSVHDFRRIIQPLIKRHPSEWPLASCRVDLLTSRPPPDSTLLEKDEVELVEKTIITYQTKYLRPPRGCLLRGDASKVHVNDVFKVIKVLMPFSTSSEWSEHDVTRIVMTLRGKSMVDGRNAEEGAIAAWFAFLELWVPYVTERPKLQRILDPFFVIVDVGQRVPATLAATIASYPPDGSPQAAPLPLDGSNFVFSCATHAYALHFAGFIYGREGLRCWVTQGNIAPPIYL